MVEVYFVHVRMSFSHVQQLALNFTYIIDDALNLISAFVLMLIIIANREFCRLAT